MTSPEVSAPPLPAGASSWRWPIWKGHGTENDFVLIDDRDDELVLDEALIRALCDRRSGIGGDGVLRVVRTPHAASEWFMDYRNADGSTAEMCGNGARVFARYLQHHALVDEVRFSIGTRAGDTEVELREDGLVTVELGPVTVLDAVALVTAPGSDSARNGRAISMPNPHVVVAMDSVDQLIRLELDAPPTVDPPLPAGQNVEFVTQLAPGHLQMRVHERGSGETRSCGTGIAAVVVAAELSRSGGGGGPTSWRVDVPGGTTWARWDGAERVALTGAAVLVGRIEPDPDWLAASTMPSDGAGRSALS
ncbi:MAG: diaminopimelate epimerase [Janthinobacterium lividum]